MNNVKIEVIMRVITEKSWGETSTLAESHVASKGEYAPAELSREVAERIAEATTLLRSRLAPAILEHAAAADRKTQQDKERVVNTDA